MTKRIGIKDIATHLGVSPSTVSRVLTPHKKSTISEKMIVAVKEAAKELGYVSDTVASGFRKQKTDTIGIVIPDLLNPLFLEIAKSAQALLSAKGYVCFIVVTENDLVLAEVEITKLISRRVEGLLLVNAFLDDSSVDICLQHKVPLVLVNRLTRDPSGVNQVLTDEAMGMNIALSHLQRLNHKHILFLSGPKSISQGETRQLAFLKYCKKHNLCGKALELPSFSFESGIEASRFLRYHKNNLTTAVIAGNDLIALGLMSDLQKHHIKIPQDFSVIGFNGTLHSALVFPPLTTVAIPHFDLGQKAAALLLKAIANPEKNAETIVLKPSLIERLSTMKKQ